MGNFAGVSNHDFNIKGKRLTKYKTDENKTV
jgi:hypothetical protein